MLQGRGPPENVRLGEKPAHAKEHRAYVVGREYVDDRFVEPPTTKKASETVSDKSVEGDVRQVPDANRYAGCLTSTSV
jgi:hypothetical protein